MKNKKVIVSLIVIVLGIAALLGYRNVVNRKMNEANGTKEYTFIVRDTDNTFNNEYKFETDESSLGKDLDNRGIIETDDSGTTRFVTAVDGKKADSSKQEWWNLKVNGENSVTGVDDTIINNGDKIEFVLTTGW
ncbi:DUF4430 domain-containing protein [Clostridium sp. SM-530-WT-3G]|uniref:DUF4430 domain-containing protein n=1 Tax=Clostridium sp. SM-530-WT-3G TaxID=2725303 RepID=UPI00145E392E|nr:DUF4430 domain-containing protein [Clostridium sp. SM-530-WT-3G]NME83947.1 DUF4430 domain-containing protein [Clostridium sp. SM-530-WT-3G]